MRQEPYVKYLAIYLDCNLNWKIQIQQVAKNIKRGVSVLFKIRSNVNAEILLNLCF